MWDVGGVRQDWDVRGGMCEFRAFEAGRKGEIELKSIAILGSTGSIGRQALQVLREMEGVFRVAALAARENDGLMLEQIREFNPRVAALLDEGRARRLKANLGESSRTVVLCGEDGIGSCITESGCDIVLNGMVGIAGLVPTLTALEAGKSVALANKESLVAGGQLVMDLASRKGIKIIPVDSEHSAIFQCIGSTPPSQVKRLLLTASGGPFRGKSREDLKEVTPSQALKHPNWKMGKKITIDSATLMNKGLEVIEARWLFGMDADSIEVVIHPQSIIHSMVEMVDGAVLAQLGNPDMRLPIQYALTYPNRIPSGLPRYDPVETGKLEFFRPDLETFPSLRLAYEALREGGTMTAVLNGANEAVVELFLKGAVPFNSIPAVVEKVLEKHNNHKNPCLDDIIYWDGWSRSKVVQLVEKDGEKFWHLR
jgi:1-deoxy-D-xylulose-5-phosphate reductoisomerase